MNKQFLLFLIGISLLCSSCVPSTVALSAGVIQNGQVAVEYRNVTVFAPAVSQTDTGYVGVISTITATVQENGSGRVFVDTLPLTDVDMQGSARLAVKVASALVSTDNRSHLDPRTCDFFFVVRTDSPIIGGPSAGAIMTIAVISLLENWTLDNHTVMTGMINPDGSIGPIGGIPYKIDAAHSVGATRFLVPKGQMTYTEMVSETISENGWTQIITHPVTKNVSEYAQTMYGMQVAEVGDINEALTYFTGWSFPTIESPHKVTNEQYITAMKPLATALLMEARASYQNASAFFNTSTIPNRYPSYDRNQVTDFLNSAEDRLLESTHWYDEEVYYTSTSKSFQSLINSHFVTAACRYFSSGDKAAYLSNLMNETLTMYINQSKTAKNAPIHGIVTLQCVGAAQQRISEAASYLDQANASLQTDSLTALYDIEYAQERVRSVQWWLNISTPFNDTGDINTTMIRQLAEEYLDDAQQASTYSGIILNEMGKTSNDLSDADTMLSAARKENDEGYSAAALFGAFESLVKANLALELVDGVTADKVERAREQASRSITEIRDQGIEPVLAVSYYEYGQSLANESSLDTAVVYYRDADMIAGALRFATPYGTQSSRYVGVTETPTVTPLVYGLTRYAGLFLLIAFIGGLGGLGLGLLIASLSSPKEKKLFLRESSLPRSIQDYYKKNK
ncbi:MAG TPA: S16 family serine protease [Candidatus Thermoplasmatota archaeon]|nr:S16 family serine protease [Candidatus Thermoplasmatota archaeon]